MLRKGGGGLEGIDFFQNSSLSTNSHTHTHTHTPLTRTPLTSHPHSLVESALEYFLQLTSEMHREAWTPVLLLCFTKILQLQQHQVHPLYCYTITLSHHHIVTPSHCHTITLSYHHTHTITLSHHHCHTITLSHHHTSSQNAFLY